MKKSYLIPFLFLACGLYVMYLGGPIFLNSTTLVELIKGFVICIVGMFIATGGFFLSIAVIME